MRLSILGCILMISGWILSIAALILLKLSAQRLGFVAAGILVEMVGLGLIAQHHRHLERGVR